MPRNKNAYLRYRIIDQCINNKRKRYNRSALAEAVSFKLGQDISEYSIDKDIKAMQDELDAPIFFDRVARCYRYTSAFSLTGLVLNDEEEKSLHTSLAVLDVLKDTEYAKSYRSLIQRLITQANTMEAEGIIEFERHEVKNGLDWFDDLYAAIGDRQALTLKYQVYGKEVKEHTVSPYMIKEFRNRFYLVARKHTQTEDELIFCYGLDRIKGLRKSKDSFVTTKGFQSRTYFKHSLGITRKLNEAPIELVLRFNQLNAPYVLSKPLHHSQRIISQSEDFLTVSIKVYTSHELNMAILGYGAGVQVLAPQSYVDYIKSVLSEMTQHYFK